VGFGKHVGSTVLRLKSLMDIVSPGAGQRAVFIDMGQTPSGRDFYMYYLDPIWSSHNPPRSATVKGQHSRWPTATLSIGNGRDARP
jgi:hypothetical protein